MSIELKVPALGESITEVEIGDWLKAKGDRVDKDAPVVTLESDKATVELPAPSAGVVSQILKKKGQTATVGEVIGLLDEAAATTSPKAEPATAPASTPAPAARESQKIMPAAERVLSQEGIRAEDVKATGPGGRLLKEDVLRHKDEEAKSALAKAKTTPPIPEAPPAPAGATPPTAASSRGEEVVPMTKLRRTLAARLVEVQNTAAMLTTFNEIDMSATMSLRKELGEAFQQKYQTRLGFMSFFVKACVDALRLIPAINAEIRGTDIVYHRYYDIAVAIGGGKGLVVPVLRSAEGMSFADIERQIMDFAQRAKENKLKPDELQGGTFTISNGGIYGSMLSTPILNPPQSGILGMHAIQERPVARDGQVVIRPMMNVALTYDHRIVDGREAVTFLKRVKEVIENPVRMVLGV
jgi:2-oxoglutarate dehydrogenase E2 component (dihydrolipoamide succinyltransferase)